MPYPRSVIGRKQRVSSLCSGGGKERVCGAGGGSVPSSPCHGAPGALPYRGNPGQTSSSPPPSNRWAPSPPPYTYRGMNAGQLSSWLSPDGQGPVAQQLGFGGPWLGPPPQKSFTSAQWHRWGEEALQSPIWGNECHLAVSSSTTAIRGGEALASFQNGLQHPLPPGLGQCMEAPSPHHRMPSICYFQWCCNFKHLFKAQKVTAWLRFCNCPKNTCRPNGYSNWYVVLLNFYTHHWIMQRRHIVNQYRLAMNVSSRTHTRLCHARPEPGNAGIQKYVTAKKEIILQLYV